MASNTYHLVPFHKGNGTGGTRETSLGDYQEGRYATERIQAGVFVPLVPLVPLIPRNGTEQDAGIKADADVRERDFCSICSACSAQGVERNRTKSMVWADVYVCYAAVE